MTDHSNNIKKFATLEEILSQPQAWQAELTYLERNPLIDEILSRTASSAEWLFVGCGSSFYLAEAAAYSWIKLTGMRARALPASELLLFPNLAQLTIPGLQAVIISRSGSTSEAVSAAALLSKEFQVPTLGITCTANSVLQKSCDITLTITSADEISLVMTKSFSTMLLALQFLAVRKSGNGGFVQTVKNMAKHFEPRVGKLFSEVRAFVDANNFDDFVFLGQGPFHGLAREGALKVMEMSCSYSQFFHTMEFRHGPKAVVGPKTCLTFFLSESGAGAESEVLAEMKKLGGAIIAVCNHATESIRKNSDLVCELGFAGPEIATLCPSIVCSQLLGFFNGIRKNLNPDAPLNLDRVVILNQGAGN
jgi:glucosamine--fructose-6-phosphate aminotransferase (isomerizing)